MYKYSNCNEIKMTTVSKQGTPFIFTNAHTDFCNTTKQHHTTNININNWKLRHLQINNILFTCILETNNTIYVHMINIPVGKHGEQTELFKVICIKCINILNIELLRLWGK